MILEGGVTKWLALGVVCEDYTHWLPGKAQGTVGYHTDDRKIFDAEKPERGKKTTGKAMKASLTGKKLTYLRD